MLSQRGQRGIALTDASVSKSLPPSSAFMFIFSWKEKRPLQLLGTTAKLATERAKQAGGVIHLALLTITYQCSL